LARARRPCLQAESSLLDISKKLTMDETDINTAWKEALMNAFLAT